jgi:hypothetical protein
MISFVSRPLYPHSGARSNRWNGGCAGPRVDLDAVVEESLPLPGIEPPFFGQMKEFRKMF